MPLVEKAHSPEAMVGWLPAAAFLLLSLLLAPTFCSIAGAWLVYLTILRKRFANETRSAGGRQVILCGFPRTGTRSLTEALRTLGFRCLHGMHLCHPTTANCFMKAYKQGNPKDWEKLFEGFSAVADYPAACSYKQLARLYPNAKIILNIRDANKWYDSFSNTLLRIGQGEQHMVFKTVKPYDDGKCVHKSLYKQFFDDKPENRDICVAAFLQHIQDVKDHVPPEKLLIYDVENDAGWPHLCQFLNVLVPQVPFPKKNATSEYNARTKRLGNFYMVVLAVYVVIVAFASMCML